ncbi:Methylated-DNA--protein-cysteine methyltransferase [hydrothermal vent metagenome]|uniref:methylated-DNA--[protein]-cysteine S-methyltransferase n=1 Tax=hydrothermal vent metagenome TaxID=652676 RepID=A0A3B1BCI5_9ZZZZ
MTFHSPIGPLAIHFNDSALCELKFLQQADDEQPQDALLMGIFAAQLQAYFSSSVSPLSFPVRLRGTDFQRRVWQALQQIPLGKVRTYGQLAQQLHSSARAVGNACRYNPVPLVVPCHRVVSASGIGGFAGSTEGAEIRIKRWLLRHEGVAL